MDKEFNIECICGYIIHFSEKDRGTTQECQFCSADVLLDPDTPINPPESPDTPLNLQTSTPPKKTYSSPFEDEDEPEVHSSLPIATHQTPYKKPDEPTVANDSYAAVVSAFDDPDAPDEEGISDKPDPDLLRSYEDPEHSNRYQKLDETQKCPRCGNPFRGNWDKQTINGEDICYICSNQATEGQPERKAITKFTATDHLEEGPKQYASLNRDAETVKGHAGGVEKFWLFNPESNEFRTMLYVLAFGTILITLFFVFTTDMDMSDQASQPVAQSTQDAPTAPLPFWARSIIAVWEIFCAIFSLLGTIYILLRLSDRMPHDEWRRDLTLITIAVSPLIIGDILIQSIYVFLDTDKLSQIAALISTKIIFIASVLITLFTLTNMLDFRIRDFFSLIFLNLFVAFLLSLLSLFVYAWIAHFAL